MFFKNLMDIPPVEHLPSFNTLIKGDEPVDENSLDQKKLDALDCNNININKIFNLFDNNQEEEEEIQFEEEEEEVQFEEDNELEAKIMEYKEAIHNMSIPNEQNSELCNYDFENMDISEINKEIEKTKKEIETDEETFQQQMQEIQKQKEASEQVTLLRRKAIALYNELISWTQSKLETDFPDSNVKTCPPLPKDVYDNYSKDPDAIFEQILLYFKDVKKEIKRK